ncbi:ferric reductase-like transmembrane domain-containing protein [Streptantibioticus rubrisoli]|uniref:Ferric reductase-like transmembrane domain-containing protein n=1 Tax=Streptantibioticus rubrisoli TaxID=1387313 RepID=A0ABT1P6A9_9ACTN|nr:ferric reductase-like transmembrane domain-containing protein [Streptantibioticus rubrisoli]MCQ4040877.1 ferric reductase-like transmembrane domain-containing protein [Streptantibioticus rubrisoli]
MTGIMQFAASGPRPLWYATRASGTIALLLLTATAVLGIAVGGRYAPQRIARFEISALHRNLSVLTLAFLGLHIVTTIADPLVPVSWWAAAVPFVSSYRAPWLGLATVASDMLLAVAVTSAVRLRLGRRRWKAVHWLAYAAWPVALVHATPGTDARLPLQLGLYTGCLAAVVTVVCWRLYRAGPGRVAARLSAALTALAVPAALGGFLFSGPTHARGGAPATPLTVRYGQSSARAPHGGSP